MKCGCYEAVAIFENNFKHKPSCGEGLGWLALEIADILEIICYDLNFTVDVRLKENKVNSPS